MNNRDDKRTKLLVETFHDEWETGAPAQFARTAARAARRRLIMERSLRGGSVLAVLTIAAWFSREKPAAPRAADELAAPSQPTRSYEILSDDELLAQVRDRPLLAVRRADGTREIIVFPRESE